MKKIIFAVFLMSLGASLHASGNQKGETARPTKTNKFVYE